MEHTAGGIQLKLPNSTGRLIFLRIPVLCLRAISQIAMGAIAPIRKAQTRCRYKAPGPKNRCGPTTPHKILPLKCTLAIGQLKPLIACGVHKPGIYANIQFKTPIWVTLDTSVATI